jgi:hypothetical protein
MHESTDTSRAHVFEPLKNAVKTFGAVWCYLMHDSLMWPVHGQYRCRTCGQLHPVPWVKNKVRSSDSIFRAAERSVTVAAQNEVS